MATDNNIKHFTATDIEKYHKGLLSNKEMHDLEKAAMDDSFLADALEGYAVAGANAGDDITELKERLAQKIAGAKIISISTAPRNSFRVLRAAVLVAFVAGASLLIYQFGFNKKSGEIAEAKTTKKEDWKLTDTAKVTATNPAVTTSTPVSEIKTGNSKPGPSSNETVVITTEKGTNPGGSTNNNVAGEKTIVTGKVTTDDLTFNKASEVQPAVTAPAKVVDEKKDSYKVTDKITEKKELAREEADKKNKLKANGQKADNDGVKDQAIQQNNRNVAASRKADEQNYSRNQAANVFRGRVTDADNNGVPFANVTNVQDNNAGTYTDARGNFNLTYPDSVLTVQVRSVGFENANVQLRNNVANNQVIMQDDRKNLSEVVVSNQKPDAANRNRDANMKLEQPEPADGWDNYGTYIANNLEIPEDLKNKQTSSGEVQVSFEVDKNGEPVNIRVEKSLCGKCDKEAIRLVKEGPKWNRKAKKGRTTVTITF
jgi:TonB family protein